MRKFALGLFVGLAVAMASAASAHAPEGKSFRIGIITYAGQPVAGGRGGPDEGGQIKRLLAELRNIRAPLTVNPGAIEQLGLKVPPGLLEEADTVIR